MITETGMVTGKVVKASGHLIVAEDMREANLADVVYVGDMKLAGEIFEMKGDRASIRLYENTAGIGCGDIVISTGAPLSVELGPGLIGNIFDGFLRPFDIMHSKYGANIPRGTGEPFLSFITHLSFLSLDREKKWRFVPSVKNGAKINGGDIIGTVEETPTIIHKILVPSYLEGEVAEISEGEFAVDESVATLKMSNGETAELPLAQKWAVRRARPYAAKTSPDTPMRTGQCVIDSLLPIAKGGTACVSGTFGSGKTSILRHIAKWNDADIIVYVACGARGSEMAEIFRELSEETKDSQSSHSLMQRTVFIASTSDMSSSECEAAVYTGITVAEYFRDMGYSVALIVDSLSRWTDAMCEISGYLEEIQGKDGYPVYLASRLAQIYERAGKVICLGNDRRDATLTVIGAVSPVGIDSNNVVEQAALRAVRVFWSLDLNGNLVHRRCFPSINLFDSYSLYSDRLEQWYSANIDKNWSQTMRDVLKLLQAENKLQEKTGLTGIDALSDSEKLILEIARSIREDYVSSTAHKQYEVMRLIIEFYQDAQKALENGANIDEILQIPMREKIIANDGNENEEAANTDTKLSDI